MSTPPDLAVTPRRRTARQWLRADAATSTGWRQPAVRHRLRNRHDSIRVVRPVSQHGIRRHGPPRPPAQAPTAQPAQPRRLRTRARHEHPSCYPISMSGRPAIHDDAQNGGGGWCLAGRAVGEPQTIDAEVVGAHPSSPRASRASTRRRSPRRPVFEISPAANARSMSAMACLVRATRRERRTLWGRAEACRPSRRARARARGRGFPSRGARFSLSTVRSCWCSDASLDRSGADTPSLVVGAVARSARTDRAGRRAIGASPGARGDLPEGVSAPLAVSPASAVVGSTPAAEGLLVPGI